MVGMIDVNSLIKKGGIIKNVEGSTLEEVFAYIEKKLELPPEYDNKTVIEELIEREKILSTAVGNGIAIPHPRRPIITKQQDERIIVCYLRSPLDMNAPDGLKVHTLFIVLSSSSQTHLGVLSSLAGIFRNREFIRFLTNQPDVNELTQKIATATADVQ